MKYNFTWEALQSMEVRQLESIKECLQDIIYKKQREKDELIYNILWLQGKVKEGEINDTQKTT